MSVSYANRSSLNLPSPLGWAVCVAGGVGIFATYWDEAWHTDIGRDSFWTPAHLLLYGAMAVVGLSIAAWGIRVLMILRSPRRAAAQLPVLAACLGGAAALAAAPIDAAWHQAFGRDSVAWSPPHVLVIFAATSIALGALVGVAPGARALRAAAGTLLLANASAVVFEYETDVPQFSETLYLPILLVAVLVVASLVHRVVPLRAPVTTTVLAYAALRLMIASILALLGRSTPDLPLAVLGLAAYDLPLRGQAQRLAAAGTATAAAAWGASALGLASQAPDAVALTAIPAIVVGALILLGTRRWTRVALPATLFLVASSTVLAATADRAVAHDPGEGTKVTDLLLSAHSDGRGRIAMQARLDDDCDHARPLRLLARRAGTTVAAPLSPDGPCNYASTITVTEPGRWFVYVELAYDGRRAEAWLPVESGDVETLTETRELYLPVGAEPSQDAGQIIAGVPIYAIGLTLLGLGIAAVRRSAQEPHPAGG